MYVLYVFNFTSQFVILAPWNAGLWDLNRERIKIDEIKWKWWILSSIIIIIIGFAWSKVRRESIKVSKGRIRGEALGWWTDNQSQPSGFPHANLRRESNTLVDNIVSPPAAQSKPPKPSEHHGECQPCTFNPSLQPPPQRVAGGAGLPYIIITSHTLS